MKVILLEDIQGVGKKGQLYEASEGYARNFLLPKKKAIEATKAKINELEHKKKAEVNKKNKEMAEAEEVKKHLEEKGVVIAVKAGESGKLFGSVTNKEISAALQEQMGISLDKKKITIPEAIKSIGTHQIEIKLYTNVVAKFSVEIVELK